MWYRTFVWPIGLPTASLVGFFFGFQFRIRYCSSYISFERPYHSLLVQCENKLRVLIAYQRRITREENLQKHAKRLTTNIEGKYKYPRIVQSTSFLPLLCLHTAVCNPANSSRNKKDDTLLGKQTDMRTENLYEGISAPISLLCTAVFENQRIYSDDTRWARDIFRNSRFVSSGQSTLTSKIKYLHTLNKEMSFPHCYLS